MSARTRGGKRDLPAPPIAFHPGFERNRRGGASMSAPMRSTVITPPCPEYPPALAALPASERPTLFLRGRLPQAPGVAVVGARQASDAGQRFARLLAAELARRGIVVWSGGAVGIDAAAHEGALEAGGPTVVVAGGGLDWPYPREHEPLFDRVLRSGGALLARVPDGVRPMPSGFIQRNVILAALTEATVVVEASLKSGARSAAAAARRLGKVLCVVPHAPWDAGGAGCALELARGARAIVDVDDVLAALREGPVPTLKRPARGAAKRAAAQPDALVLPHVLAQDAHAQDTRAQDAHAQDTHAQETHAQDASVQDAPAQTMSAVLAAPLDEACGVVLAALTHQPTHVDEVCERAGLSFQAASLALLTLTLHAVVVEGPAGFFRRATRP
jgi:DNA processing protein